MHVYSNIKLDVIYAQDVKNSLESISSTKRQSTEPMFSALPRTPRHAALAEHLKRYGRAGLASMRPGECFDLARKKLLKDMIFRPNLEQHALAVLSQCILLDIALPLHAESRRLAEEAVPSHMRYLYAMSQDSRIVQTSVPFEPVLAIAAMRLMSQSDTTVQNMLGTLNTRLLGGGLVDRGPEGELFARLLLRLAQISAQKKRVQRNVAEPTSKTVGGGFSKSEISRHSITLQDFLDALVNDELWSTAKQSVPAFAKARVAKGWINLVAFQRSCKDVQQFSQADLLALWLKGAAVQGAAGQFSWDLIIPVYCGSLDRWELDNFSAVVVQVKYRAVGDGEKKAEATVGPALYREDGETGHRGNASKVPYLVLFMDLGSTSVCAVNRHRAVFSYDTPQNTGCPHRLEDFEHPRYLLKVRGCDTCAYRVIQDFNIVAQMEALLMST